VAVVGYDDAKQSFICRNSWGDAWGDQGYCYLPYGYLTSPQLAFDAWVVRTVEAPVYSNPDPTPDPGPGPTPSPEPNPGPTPAHNTFWDSIIHFFKSLFGLK
jgi:hypothetical protein